jgi:DNA-directed RNA polymerase subunit RPC12/RpoP
MAMKIRCSDCSKKISIDEAFAGGACRCPYCKAIVLVPGEARGGTPARPSSPRPDAPGAAADAEVATPALAPEDVPMADPVRIQSYAAVVLIALLILAMLAGVVVWLTIWLHKGESKAVQTPNEMVEVAIPANPLKPTIGGASVAGDVKIAAPVVYVIDCGDSMADMIDNSAKIVGVSIRSLDAQEKFTVIMAMPEGGAEHPSGAVKLPAGAVMLQNALVNGGRPGEKDALKFMLDLEETRVGGKVVVAPAIKAALAMNPKTVVVFTNKTVQDAEALAGEAHKAGVNIVTMGMNADDDVKESLKKFSEAAQSENRAYTSSMLETWVEQFKNEEQ